MHAERRAIEALAQHLSSRGIEVENRDWVRAAYSRDYWPLAVLLEKMGVKPEPPLLVARPSSKEELVEVVEAAYQYRVPLVPYSGGSGVLGGALPRGQAVVVDLSRLNHYHWHDKDSMIVYAEAGTPLWELEEWLQKQGYSLRHYPQSYPEAQVGGLIATRSIGQYSGLYGGIEDMVLGVEVAVPRLGLVKTRPTPRRAVGPRLEELFIGSEGAYGVVAAAYLAAKKTPRAEAKLSFLFPSFREAIGFAKKLSQEMAPVAVMRVYDEWETALHFSRHTGGWGSIAILVVEHVYEGVVEAVAEEAKHSAREHSGRELGPGPVEEWLSTRFAVTKSIKSLVEAGLWFDTIEVTLPWSRGLEAYKAMRERVLSVKGVVSFTAHASHFYPWGFCLYTTIVYQPGGSAEEAKRLYNEVWAAVLEETARMGGSISHHHNIGLHRVQWLGLELGREGVELLRRVKKALDPECLLNPGKLVEC